MQEILCPHCGGVISAQDASLEARLRDRELEILRLQGELEQLCARFELQLQHKDDEITIYKGIAERLTGAPSFASAPAVGDNADLVRALEQSVAGLMRVREMLLRSGIGSEKE